MNFREKIKSALKEQNVKQRELANWLNISDKFVSLVLTGRQPMPLAMAIGIEDILGLNGLELMTMQLKGGFIKSKAKHLLERYNVYWDHRKNDYSLEHIEKLIVGVGDDLIFVSSIYFDNCFADITLKDDKGADEFYISRISKSIFTALRISDFYVTIEEADNYFEVWENYKNRISGKK